MRNLAKECRRLELAVLIVLTSLFTGCASPKFDYVPVSKQISEPPIGTVSTAHVGDTLVQQGTLVHHDIVRVEGQHSLGLLGPYTITPGVYLKTGENDESNFYQTSNDIAGGGQLIRAALADPTKSVQAFKREKKLCGISVFNAQVCTDKATYHFDVLPIASPNAFQQSLIYSGKVGNRIRIGYREFSGSLARPAFNNEAEYDLGESKVIGYKGARVEVLEATNESIRYRVLSNFNVR